ncbi:DUF6340 family protein [Pontibacter lucknowensis]|uniref:Tetratricopeptide repeat-containing protein n=1 Tax=Pontibacter lucknowensis TaxID=1077936 RepID=A0A1N6WAC8_9BACT|nr:DUF6340 family protein [Pontibacter lucknowensis]SIQ87101.1 hypothetical protein SAMN05421545_1440 [Pontibacter lucknowensis]
MKSSKLLAILLWSVLALQLSSCVSVVMMETVRPPVVRVSPDQWKVLVVNRYDAATQTSSKNGNVIEVLREGAYQAAGGVMGAVYSDSTFVLINPDQAVTLPPSSPKLSEAEVQELYTQYRPHLILTLDKFDTRFGKEVNSYEDEDGYKTRTANYDLVVASTWSLYDSTGILLDQATIEQSDFYDSRTVVSGLLAIGPAMGKAGPAVNQLAVETGYSYWDRFYPQPILLARQIYTGSPFQGLNLMLLMGQFQQAITTLQPLAQDLSTKTGIRAAHNLAVAYEAAGDYEQATHWARQAQGKGDKLSNNLMQLWATAGLIK